MRDRTTEAPSTHRQRILIVALLLATAIPRAGCISLPEPPPRDQAVSTDGPIPDRPQLDAAPPDQRPDTQPPDQTPAADAATCGNGKIDPGEECEPGIAVSKRCAQLKKGTYGTPTCTTCKFDLTGCKTCPTTKGRICSKDGWCWQNPLPKGDPLTDVWGTSDTNVYAVGYNGTILHYDGTFWTATDVNVSGELTLLNAVWGTSSSNVFVVGYSVPNISGKSYGVIMHSNGKTWTKKVVAPSVSFEDVRGTGPTDVYAVGDEIWHYDGSSWKKVNQNISQNPDLEAVWAASPDYVFAAGRGGLILHYNGKSWSKMQAGTKDYLADIWGASRIDVYIVGTSGTILELSGATWKQMSSGTNVELEAISGSSATDVYATGANGTVLHYDGKAWHTEPPPLGETSYLTGLWVNKANSLFASNKVGMVLRRDSSGWANTSFGTHRTFKSIWGNSGSDIYAVGENGVIVHSNGKGWQPMFSPTNKYLKQVWGSGSSDIWAVGTKGTILHYSGGPWSQVTSPTNNNLNTVWGSSATDIYAMGDSNTVLKYNGSAWTALKTTNHSSTEYYDIWGLSSSDLYIAAGGSGFYHYDGKSWAEKKCNVSYLSAYSICGIQKSTQVELFLAGDSWRLLHYNGKSFQVQNPKNNYSDLVGIWGSSLTDVYSVGWYGKIYHYDSTTWKRMETGAFTDLNDVWGDGPDNVYAVGENGTILNRCGQ